MPDSIITKKALLGEVLDLRQRLQEAVETLEAIRSGEVDALVVSGPGGERVYTLEGADQVYRLLVETMSDGAVTVATDGTILYSNRRFGELVKTTLEEVIGSSLQRYIVPDEREALSALLAQSRSGGGRAHLSLAASGGSAIPVSITTRSLPIGNLGSIVALISDLSDIVAATKRLQESEDRFRYMFEHSPVGTSMTSLQGEIHVNKAFCDMLGYSEAEIQNRSWHDISFAQDIPATQQVIDQLLSGQRESARFVKRYLHKNGSVIWGDVSISLRRDREGKPLYFISSVLDITERKKAEEEVLHLNAELEQRVADRTARLEAAYQELEAFSYSVSHDLRTPLRAIDGYSRLLLKKFDERLDAEGKRLLHVVRDNTVRMAQLIDDILSFSRAGRLEMRYSEVDMEAMVQDVWQELCNVATGRELRLDLKPLPPVRGDPTMLRQIWMNLIGNAVKFTRPRAIARIEVSGAVDGCECVYHISDNGVGFNPRYEDKLFGVFQRLHGLDEFEGTGIGLAIVKRIVTRHGGRAWAEGEIDAGATLHFTLPSREASHGHER